MDSYSRVAKESRVIALRCVIAVALGGLLSLFFPTSRAEAPAVPALAGEWNGRPVWVAADRAVDSSGRLSVALLGEHVVRTKTALAQRNARDLARLRADTRSHALQSAAAIDECQRFTTWTPHHFEPVSTVANLADHADVIVAGTVIAQREGIFYDTPGTLLLLQADYLKGQPAVLTYLFFPYANIRTAHGMLCSRPHLQYAGTPTKGDRFLVFSMISPYTTGELTILAPDPAKELVHESQGGRLYLPPPFRLATPFPASFEGARDLVRESFSARTE